MGLLHNTQTYVYLMSDIFGARQQHGLQVVVNLLGPSDTMYGDTDLANIGPGGTKPFTMLIYH